MIQGKSNAYISITGKEGKFKKSTRFDSKGISDKNFDIWYYPKGFENQKIRYTEYNKQDIWWHSNQPWIMGVPLDNIKIVLYSRSSGLPANYSNLLICGHNSGLCLCLWS